MAYLAINLFGSFEVYLSPPLRSASDNAPAATVTPKVHLADTKNLRGEAVTGFRSNKARALLAYLAVEANRPVMRNRLATLLWGEYPEAQARKSLRNVLANLRDLLSPLLPLDPPILTIDRQTVQLSVDHNGCFVDVVQFDEFIRNAESAASDLSTQTYLTRAVALYQADLLAGLEAIDSPDFEEWRVVQQEIRHRQALQALNQLTDIHIQQSDFSQAVDYAHQQLQLEAWQEGAHRQLIYALAAQGDRSGALIQFDNCCRVIQRELGVEPEESTLALVESIKSGSFVLTTSGDGSCAAPATDVLTVRNGAGNESSPKQQTPPPRSSTPHPAAALSKTVQILSRLAPLPDQELFGTERARKRIYNVLQQTDRPWLVALDGIGGIGKTTLATLIVHDFVKSERFAAIAWVSAKQEEFHPTVGLATTGRPALDETTLTNVLLEQFMVQPPLTASQTEKMQLLYQLLHERSMLVIVDNLESVADYQALVPYLRQLANPSKFLITSRYTLQSYSDIYCYSLMELEAGDALAFLRHEAAIRNNSRLADATDAQLETIYAVVGGNPLALKLVVGQLTFLPLDQVLANLREARGKRIDQLYTYIYWQAWQVLAEPSRQLLLSLPVVPNGTFAQLALASELDIEDLQEALAQLHALSLVQTSGDLDEPRYRLHRLTETFLMQEVLAWQ